MTHPVAGATSHNDAPPRTPSSTSVRPPRPREGGRSEGDVPGAGWEHDVTNRWLRAVADAGFLPGRRADARAFLRDLLDRLIAVMQAAEFDPGAAREIGAELVARRIATPKALGATIRFLDEELHRIHGRDGVTVEEQGNPGATGDDGPDGLRIGGPERVPAILEQVANGFGEAMRDHALSAAESLSRSERIHWRARQDSLRAELQAALLRDPVTHLPNRATLRDHLTRLIGESEDGTRLGLALLSIDDFAGLNDALGHARGDELLVTVADRLRATTDEHFLAHLGGEQFVLAVDGVEGLDQLVKLTDAATRAIADAKLSDVGGYGLRVTVTAGLVEAYARRTDPDGWLRDAHLALRWARRDRRAWAAYDPARAEDETARQLLAAAMPAALDRGEFEAYFQPLWDLRTGRITGVEALARWHRPDGEILGPQPFITVAERTGLIRPLGRTVLEQACRAGASWPGLLISVNLSPLQLDDPGLVAGVAAVLHGTGLPAERLQLEITESAAADGHAGTLRTLADLGISLAVDDFGTGYSSLAMLTNPPITTVKLAAELAGAPTATLRHTIDLCHDLGITVIAEGIETESQAAMLRDLGCDTGQGFLFGRPVPAPDLRLN